VLFLDNKENDVVILVLKVRRIFLFILSDYSFVIGFLVQSSLILKIYNNLFCKL